MIKEYNMTLEGTEIEINKFIKEIQNLMMKYNITVRDEEIIK